MTRDGVRTFLPLRHLSMAQPAITRLTRWKHYKRLMGMRPLPPVFFSKDVILGQLRGEIA